MQSKSASVLNHRKWNRRLMNLLWTCAAIIFIVEIIVAVLYYQTKPMPPLPEYVFKFVLAPSVTVCLLNAACELAVRLLERRHKNIQPYVITSVCIMICAILMIAHHYVTVVFVVCAVPVLFSLVYNNTRILSFAFFASLFLSIAIYIGYFSIVSPPELVANLGNLPANIAILFVAYLAGLIILNRFNEILDTLMETEYSLYEAEVARLRTESDTNAKERIIANMSATLRTPADGIVSLSEQAINDAPLENQNYLHQIKSHAEKLSAIINDVLYVSQIKSGNARLIQAPFDLHRVLRECENVTAQDAYAKGLRLYFYNETGLANKIVGDKSRLQQVLLAFLSNSVKFTEHGSVTLVARHEPDFSKYGFVKLYFEISDTGVGMAEEARAKIFEPFRPAGASNSIGMGLCVAQNIVEAMGGQIEVRSISDIGSRFSFSLEFALSHEATEMPQPHKEIEILLCDDDEISRQVIVQNLEKLGLRVTLAKNGQAGVEAACKREQNGNPFDLILMDIHMPVMTGVEATRILEGKNIKAPVIALTATASDENIKKYIAAGMSGCLNKPVKADELLACLSEHLAPAAAAVLPKKTASPQTPVRQEGGAAIDSAAGIENFVGNKQAYTQALKAFAKKYAKTPDMLEQAAKNKDFLLAQKTAHTEKGAAAIIGARKLSEHLAVLEEAFRRDGLYFENSMIDEYRAEHSKVLRNIAEQNN